MIAVFPGFLVGWFHTVSLVFEDRHQSFLCFILWLFSGGMNVVSFVFFCRGIGSAIRGGDNLKPAFYWSFVQYASAIHF